MSLPILYKRTKTGIVKVELHGYTLWVSNHFKKSGWFRLCGSGLKWKHKDLGLMFSERNGYTKYIKIGNWIISYLPKNKLINLKK